MEELKREVERTGRVLEEWDEGNSDVGRGLGGKGVGMGMGGEKKGAGAQAAMVASSMAEKVPFGNSHVAPVVVAAA